MMDCLTARERQVVHLLAAGMTNAEIGRAIGCSHKTVKNHISRVLFALELQTRTQVAALFYRLKIVQLQDENALFRDENALLRGHISEWKPTEKEAITR